MLQTTWQDLEGKVLDEKLLLVRYLGGSGGTAVFLADELGDARPTAIKLIPIEARSPDAQLARLRAAMGLSHPNLLRIFDVGHFSAEDGEFLYARMQYADENLGEFLPRRTLTVEEAHQLIHPVLDALTYLHAQGFVHGRIKPPNVLAIGEQVKLSAEIYPAGEFASLDAASVYTAPEAASEGITAAADCWSLGVTLLEALTGEPLSWDRKGDPPVPETLPAPFSRIVGHCLRCDPQQRWSVSEIGACLRLQARAARAATAPVPATPAIPEPRKFDSPRRMAIAGVAALAIAAAVGILAIRGDHSGAPAPTAQQTVKSTQPSAGQQAIAGPAAQSGPQDPAAVEATAPAAPPSDANESSRAVVPAGLKEAVPQNEQEFILHREMPNVSQGALNTIHGTVRVSIRLEVNSSGEVERARFLSHGPSNYFAERAMRAAKLWRFRPQDSMAENAASQWVLRFHYRKSGTNVIPERTGS
jgi:outer membrane biosynthesis protein TonB